MKKRDLRFISDLFSFRIIKDEFDYEYVVFENSSIDEIHNVLDKTEFEALENHVHLCDHIKMKDMEQLTITGNRLGTALLYTLKAAYPQKEFVVYVSISIKDSMIIRFHQKWKDECYYYDSNQEGANEKILKFES